MSGFEQGYCHLLRKIFRLICHAFEATGRAVEVVGLPIELRWFLEFEAALLRP